MSNENSLRKLLEPMQIKNTVFQSRIAMAPMHPFGYPAGEGRTLGPDILGYYQRRLHGDLGLLITQAFSVRQQDRQFQSMGMVTREQQEDLAKLAKLAHDNGTVIFAQIAFPAKGWHRHESIDGLSAEEIRQIEGEFVAAALRAQAAGCDGVELHGANMFFLNLFSSPISNHRTDEYGGDLQGRLHLASDIIRGIRKEAGEDFLIDYRMGWNRDLNTDIETAKALEAAGIDLFHISYGIRESDRMMPAEYPPVVSFPGTTREKQLTGPEYPFGDVVYTGAQIKKALRIPVILVDEIKTLERGEKLLEDHAGDFIAYGRPFLADDHFIEHGEEDPSFLECAYCKDCAWFDDYSKCPKDILRRTGRSNLLKYSKKKGAPTQ